MKKKNNLSAGVMLIGVALVYYYFFIALVAPPSFERYVDLALVSEEDIMQGITSVLLFHAERDSKYAKKKIRTYNLRILDGVPSDSYIRAVNEYDIPRVWRGTVKRRIIDNEITVTIFVSNIISTSENQMTMDLEFKYGKRREFSNRFYLKKNRQRWEIEGFDGSQQDYRDIKLLRQ